MSIFKKIHAVQAALAVDGITKDQTNSFDKYKFRGIDDVYNSLAGLLSKHKLVIIPHVQAFDSNQVQTSQGKPAMHSIVTVKYVLADAETDGSKSTSQTECLVIGEASDRGDKGMNKAMSSAYKLMAFQMFCIPTESGSADSETESVEHQAFIGQPEIDQLMELIERTNTDLKGFCEWQEIETLNAMPLIRFAHAMTTLNKKEQRMADQYAKEQEDTAKSQQGEQ